MTNPNQTFKDARLKAEWAEHHIHELFGKCRALLDSDLARLAVENDAEAGQQRVKTISMTEFPPSIPLIIGDIVHNLRTAFDYIMVAITGEKWMALPTTKTRDKVIATGHYGTIETRMPEFAKFILDVIQPYQGGQFLLWELSQLDRIDKHRLIIPTINQTLRAGVRIEDQGGERFVSWFVTGEGFSTNQTFPGPIKIHNEGYPTLSIRFGPGTPFEDESVLETLSKFSELAIQAIERFERFHFGKV